MGGAWACPCSGESPARPCLSFPSQGSSATSWRLSEPQFGSTWWCDRAPTASLGRWQQVTMLMSPPCVYSSLFWGCPCRGRPDGGSPHRGLTLLEGSAVSAPCQAVAPCPRVLQGCPQACPAPPSKRTLSPQTFWSPLCPHRSCGSLAPISAKSIHLPWPSWVSPMGARPGPGLCPASLPGSPTPPSAQRVPKAGGDHPGVFAPSRLEMSWAHPISIPDPILVSNPIPIPAPPWDQPPPQAWWEQPPKRCCARRRLPGPGSCRSRPWRFLIDGGD